MAEALACAKELQGDGTIHAHGFLAVANAFQHSTMADIANLLVSRMHDLTEAEIVERVINFVEHLQREDHYKHDQHQEQLEQLEKEFHNNNSGPPVNTFLSVRPRMFLDSSPALLTCTQSSSTFILCIISEMPIELKMRL